MHSYPYGTPVISGNLKTSAADFIVDEALGFEPVGEGEHLFLQVEKSELTTPDLINLVAGDFGIKPRDIGYSGLKDKMAITRQWLSLHMPGQMNKISPPDADTYTVLKQVWHNRKLRPGTHRANRFEVLLREVDHFDEAAQRQFESIRISGMANYFGQQRFGAKQDNVERALQVFANARKSRKLSRNKKSLYLSALRSHLFNQILSKRIDSGIWSEPIEGDVFMLTGSQSIFHEKLNHDLLNRFQQFDISNTGSLYGNGTSKLCDNAFEIEQQVFADNHGIIQCLSDQGAKLQMRALRVAVSDFSFDYQADKKQLAIRAVLPRGSYFTSLLNHFVDTDKTSLQAHCPQNKLPVA